ncbi:MAG: aminotransferase class V-fold PLP-dependent enzyme [Clostridiales bacterium]|nr:aminotransferase class V-fold PLP-dependent enzyme [Candidatus Apopatousia equi]
MIYFDNASTTNKKPFSVKWEVFKSLTKKYCANPGRSAHKLSLNAGNVVFETRLLVNDFFNVGAPENIIFTSGCTEALNTAIFGTYKKNGHVIISSNEHNSVARPLKMLEKEGKIKLTIVKTNEKGLITPEMIEKEITADTYLVIVNHQSNVIGACQDIHSIGKMCKKHNLIFMIDCAQSAGHKKIDMQKDNIDILCTAGHKGLLALQGVGLLCYQKHIEIKPLKFGGTGTYSESLLPPTVSPESLEAGTSPTPAIFSLKAGIKYVSKHFDEINNKIENLTKYALEKLSQIENVKLYTQKDCYNGVISFTMKDYQPSEVVDYLNEHNIFVRSGLHCAPLVHERIGTIKSGGTIRISFSYNNSKRQIDKFIKVLKELK